MATANTRRNPSDDPLELYNTEERAVTAALKAGVFEGTCALWDPCDGLGGLSDPLMAAGIDVFRSDIAARGRGIVEMDFLSCPTAMGLPIAFNPPFKRTAEFLDHACAITDKVFMFNRTSVLETVPRAKSFTSRRWPLKYYYQFAYRVGCTKGETQEPQAKAVMYAWYVFDKSYIGEPVLRWLY